MSRHGKPARSIRFLTPEQGSQLVVASPEPERTWWLFLLSTGLRKPELTDLRWPSVHLNPVGPFKHGFIRVEAETSNGRKHRDIPLTPELQRRLAELRDTAQDTENHLFTTMNGTPLVNTLSRKLSKALKRAGLNPHAVSTHGLGHSFARGLLLSGARLPAVSQLLGHVSTQQTLDTYIHALPRDLQTSIEHLPFRV